MKAIKMSMKPVLAAPVPQTQLKGGIGQTLLRPDQIKRAEADRKRYLKEQAERRAWQKLFADAHKSGSISTSKLPS